MVHPPLELPARNLAPAQALQPLAIARAPGAGRTAVVLLAQQLAPAAADIFASKTLLALGREQPVLLPLMGFVAAQAVHQLTGPVAQMTKGQWTLQATRAFERNSLQAHQGRADFWQAHHGHSTAVTHRVVNDVPWVVGMLVGLMHQGGALGMTLAAQMVVLAALVDRTLFVDLAVCCVLGGMAGVAAAKVTAWRISSTQHPLGDPHARYGHLRERMWDNVLLGNSGNFASWNAQYAAAKRGYRAEQVTLVSLTTGVTTLGQVAATSYFGLRLAHLGHQMWQRGEQEALVAYLLPVAARSVTLLGQTSEVGKWATAMGHHANILARLRGEIVAPTLNPEAIVLNNLGRDPKAIVVTARDGTRLPIEQLLSSPPANGRFTVRGNNGSGKSMLGAALKQRFGARALVLPAVHDLMLGSIAAGSSGETAARNLEAVAADLMRYDGITLLYLDEWDAALDANKRAQMSALIDRMANAVCVLDVTHRPAETLEEQR